MDTEKKSSLMRQVKDIFIGPPIIVDSKVFHKISLIAFFAWIGLGADGLSSSSYGPEEAFRVLQGHPYLGIFVALATAATVFIIGANYSQIIELFPSSTGSGGYIVASKFLSPKGGMVSGCALFIDYILTITVSIAAGAAAIFSFLPAAWSPYRLEFAIAGVLIMILLNLRGVKESVLILAPIFILFLITHLIVIFYAVYANPVSPSAFAAAVEADMHKASADIGILGAVILVLKAFSMGAGTYTGLEAVSNGIPILREPKVKTAKKTMEYMMFSLAFTAGGLMLAYIFYNVGSQGDKTFNAILLGGITEGWGAMGHYFLVVTLISEAALLFVGAQAGFIDGPRILSNMALDGWVPKRFSLLSDRFVNQNGIIIVGGAALAMMILAEGSVQFLVVLYSINVFITFTLSMLGTQIYFWHMRRSKMEKWLRKFCVCLLGLFVTSFFLLSVTILKFEEGGWMTIIITGFMVAVCLMIRRHYDYIARLLERLDTQISQLDPKAPEQPDEAIKKLDMSREFEADKKTAILLVKDFNGMGLHMVASILSLFPGNFRNFVFVHIGIMDSGNFKGMSEIDRLKEHTKGEVDKYVSLIRHQGYYAEGIYTLGTDVTEEIETKILPQIRERFPDSVFFGGQVIPPKYSLMSRLLDNYTIFALQGRLNRHGIPFVILPIKT
ncbi:MAG: APC family permease [Candidatus Altiarchaeota archaeon]